MLTEGGAVAGARDYPWDGAAKRRKLAKQLYDLAKQLVEMDGASIKD